jgi:hypothetical protein
MYSIISKVGKAFVGNIDRINGFAGNVTRATGNVVDITDIIRKDYENLKLATGRSTSGSLFAYGFAEFADAVGCGDTVCAAVALVGCTADLIELGSTFAPNLNISVMPITKPVSLSCKAFVSYCRSGRLKSLPWVKCQRFVEIL